MTRCCILDADYDPDNMHPMERRILTMACHQRKLRAAIIGCGGIAQVHQKVLMSLAEAE